MAGRVAAGLLTKEPLFAVEIYGFLSLLFVSLSQRRESMEESEAEIAKTKWRECKRFFLKVTVKKKEGEREVVFDDEEKARVSTHSHFSRALSLSVCRLRPRRIARVSQLLLSTHPCGEHWALSARPSASPRAARLPSAPPRESAAAAST